LVRTGRGRELMPINVEPGYFSAKRYYELYRPGGVEGNIFNYEGKMRALSKVKIPILALFGGKEEYAAMPVKRMIKVLSHKFMHAYSKGTMVPDADHCFCLQEEEAEEVVSSWLKYMIWPKRGRRRR